jgi:hypothetical protein
MNTDAPGFKFEQKVTKLTKADFCFLFFLRFLPFLGVNGFFPRLCSLAFFRLRGTP